MNREKPVVVVVTNVYFPAIGGISTYIKGISDVLEKRGYEVQVISYPFSMIQREDRMSEGFARRLVHELLVLAFTFYSLAKILSHWLKGRTLIVHSHSASFCLGIGVISRLLGAGEVHTFHSPIERCSLRLKVFVPMADALVCVSDEHRDQYVSICGIPADSDVAPSGVDCGFFAPIPEEARKDHRKSVMKELDLEDRPGPLILFVGRIVREKGVFVLRDAAERICEEFKDATFILAGPIDQTRQYADDAKSLMAKSGARPRFFLVGALDHARLRNAYNAADALAFPSLWEEASGTVVVEAMASGLPVVATRVGGIKSRVVEGVTGHLIEPGSASELAAAILDILRDSSKSSMMRRKSREIAVEKYSLEVIADKYEEIYRKALHS